MRLGSGTGKRSAATLCKLRDGGYTGAACLPLDSKLSSFYNFLKECFLIHKCVKLGSGDPSQLLSTLQWTELAGTVSLLYGMLLHQGRDTARDSALPPLPTHTLAVATGI